MKLILTNRKLFISGGDSEVIRALEEATSYTVAGHYFSPAFKTKRWDGREHLLQLSRNEGYFVPAGLYEDVRAKLDELGEEYQVIEQTHVRFPKTKMDWNPDIVLRDYQNDAVESVLKAVHKGVGVLKMPIRSGKTKTAARLIYRLGRPTLFCVPSQMLLHQTAEAFREALPTAVIGLIGDGQNEIGFITIATLQSLARLRAGQLRKPKRTKAMTEDDWKLVEGDWRAKVKAMKRRYKEITEAFDVVIVDEAHHMRGEGDWYKITYEMDARYKIGLSATAYPDNETEAERGIIWMKATCGPIRIDVPTSDLVAAGFLMRQNVAMVRITKPNLRGQRWSNTLRQEAITQNRVRNRTIARLCAKYVDEGLKVLIVANRFDHIEALEDCLDNERVAYRVVTGKDGAEARAEKVDGFVAGEYGALIGTVLGEGVDIPSVDVVINAEGGKDDKTTVQRQRNLTISAGKKRAILVDFLDETNEYFETHSRARLAAYQSEPSFRVKIIG
jgi:ATP-dependent helicase IRC3